MDSLKMSDFLRTIVMDMKQNDEMEVEAWVSWGSLEVPRLLSTSKFSTKLFPGVPTHLIEAISLGRYQQNPIAEVLNLWHH
jgi:transcriptional accessory protein Tex/SPT6